MRLDWRLPPVGLLPEALSQRVVKEVLLEYDGPQLVLLEHGSDNFIGLAVDVEQTRVRWLYTPISTLELEALSRGAEPLRNAFLKSKLILADHDSTSGQMVEAWEVEPRNIPDGALPERGAILPSQPAAPSLAPDPMFRLQGRSTDEHRITFGDLSALTSKLQNLWNALAADSFETPPTLSAVGIVSGSLRLLVHTDNLPLFNRLAEIYQRLIWATDDPRATRELLSTSTEPSRLASTYADYLRTLQQHGLEVFAEWSGGAAFMGHDAAQHARNAISDSLPSLEILPPEPFTVRGYFEGFSRQGRGRFEFYDLETTGRYEGTVDTRLRKQIRDDFVIVLGLFSRKYEVEIQPRRSGRETKYRLLSYREMPDTQDLLAN